MQQSWHFAVRVFNPGKKSEKTFHFLWADRIANRILQGGQQFVQVGKNKLRRIFSGENWKAGIFTDKTEIVKAIILFQENFFG